MNKTIDDFVNDPANDLNDLTGNQFDARFDKFCQSNGISVAECEKWAEDFQTFLNENRTFVIGPEQSRVLYRFYPF